MRGTPLASAIAGFSAAALTIEGATDMQGPAGDAQRTDGTAST